MLKDLTPTGERADGGKGMVVNENGREPTRAFDHYEAILYAFYNKEMRIRDTEMAVALEDCLRIIDIAEYLGCLNVIGKPVEVALMKHGQDLFRSIKSLPIGWATMSWSIKSEIIFRESIIHLAGDYKRTRNNTVAMNELAKSPILKQLVEEHHRKLINKGKDLEMTIMSTYPGDMCTPSKKLPIKREDYSRDILVWMALTFFHHWLGQRIILQRGYHSEDGGYELYKQLGSAGEAYMDRTVMNQFHNRFPMTKKAMNVLENHLLEVKECIKGIVDKSGILKSNCQLDVNRFPVDYLTCVDFDRNEFPWMEEERLSATTSGLKRDRRPGGNEIALQNLENENVKKKARYD